MILLCTVLTYLFSASACMGQSIELPVRIVYTVETQLSGGNAYQENMMTSGSAGTYRIVDIYRIDSIVQHKMDSLTNDTLSTMYSSGNDIFVRKYDNSETSELQKAVGMYLPDQFYKYKITKQTDRIVGFNVAKIEASRSDQTEYEFWAATITTTRQIETDIPSNPLYLQFGNSDNIFLKSISIARHNNLKMTTTLTAVHVKNLQ